MIRLKNNKIDKLEIDCLKPNMHFGLSSLLNDKTSLDIIKKYIK